MIRISSGLLLGLLIGAALGVRMGVDFAQAEHAAEKQRALRLCEKPNALGTYFVGKMGGTWNCFYRQPSYPFRIKHAVLVGVNDD